MTTDRYRGLVQFSCDEPMCSTSSRTYEQSDWQDAVDDLKSEGWVFYQEGGVWMHRCPSCRRS